MTSLVYVDTNLFISALEGPCAVSDHAWLILEAIEAGEIVGATSELTLAEVLVHPLRCGDERLIESYEAMIASSPVFTVLPVGREILVAAAIHLASAQRMGADHFVTRDARLAAISPIPVVDGGPQSLEAIRKALP